MFGQNQGSQALLNAPWFTGGTATTTKPQFLIEPAGTTSTGWNTAGTGFGVNAPSGFTGNLIDFQVNGVSKGKLDPAGLLTLASGLTSGSVIQSTGNIQSGQNLWLTSNTGILFFGASNDVAVARDAANTLAQRNGTTAQTSRVYNSFTDASNGSWAEISAGVTANTVIIGSKGNGTGASTLTNLQFNVNGSVAAVLTANGLGYGTGQGGTVTQATSKSTSVTLNKVCGQITTSSAMLAGSSAVSFTLTNSAIAATDVVHSSIASGATANSYTVTVSATAAGSCVIQVQNITAATALSEAIVINFTVMKAVNA